MNDLRNEIRAAFEREQREFPPAGNLRPVIVRSATTQHRRKQPNFQWLAVAAVVMITVLVVAGLMTSRLTNRGAVTHPRSTPSPVVDYGSPPAGVALFYVADPAHPGWYIGIDWTGKPRGTIKLAQPLDQFTNLRQSHDGSGFFADNRGVTNAASLDRLGQPLAAFPIPNGLRQLLWADDNRHLCSLAWQGGNVLLSWHVPGFTSTVAVVGKLNSLGESDIGLASCSFATDPRAVLVRVTGGQIPMPTEYIVISLATGKVLASEKIQAGMSNDVVVSHDSDLVGLSPFSSGAHTIVRDLSTGVTTNLDPKLDILAFSGDDTVALVTPQAWTAGFPTQLEAIELATGKVLWTYNGGQELVTFLAQPDGGSFALYFKPAGNTSLKPPIDVLIERPDGSSIAVPGQFAQP